MIEFLLSLILLVMLFVIYKLRKLPWYISEYEGIQMHIWKELMDINNHYKNKAMNYSRIYERREDDRRKIFEINNGIINIKSFKVPNLINKIIYKFIIVRVLNIP